MVLDDPGPYAYLDNNRTVHYFHRRHHLAKQHHGCAHDSNNRPINTFCHRHRILAWSSQGCRLIFVPETIFEMQ